MTDHYVPPPGHSIMFPSPSLAEAVAACPDGLSRRGPNAPSAEQRAVMQVVYDASADVIDALLRARDRGEDGRKAVQPLLQALSRSLLPCPPGVERDVAERRVQALHRWSYAQRSKRVTDADAIELATEASMWAVRGITA
jgi:hypothetical protein